MLVFFLGAALFAWLLEIPERKRRRAFCLRNECDFGVWYDRHYAGSGISRDVTLGIAEALGFETGCSPTQLLPDDEIQGNLSLDRYGPTNLCDSFELADNALEILLDRFGVPSPLDNAGWQTLDDVIRSVDAAVKSRPTPAAPQL